MVWAISATVSVCDVCNLCGSGPFSKYGHVVQLFRAGGDVFS